MHNVPPELVYGICSLLSVDDILNFRLVNKLSADVGAAFMLPEVTFYMHRVDLDRLEAISLHPIFSKHVTSLTYFAETLDSPQVSWREFVQDHKRRMRWDGNLRKSNAMPAQLMAEYKRYRDAVDEQDKLMEGKRDLDLLKEVLPRFPRLKQLTMSAGNLFYEKCYQTRRNKPLSEFFQIGYMGGAHPEGKRQLDALLRANAHSPCALTSFRAGTVHWRFFKRSERELTRMFKPLANLTSIELSVSVDPADERIHEGNSLRKCLRVLSKGAMRNIFQHMPQLETLCVEILSLEYDAIEKAAVLRDIIAPGFRWPNLKELVLGGFAGDRTEIMNVLLLHKNTLRKLCLRDVTLVSTSWRRLLPDIRKNLRLEEACICGDIYGIHEQGPDPDMDGPLVNDPMDIPNLEYWGLSVPEVDFDDMRDSINMYCRQGGEKYPDEVPLSRDIVTQYYCEYVKPFFENDDYSGDYEEDDDSDGLGLNASEENWEDVSDDEEEDDDDDDEDMSDGAMGVFHGDMPMEHVHMMMENMVDMPDAIYYDDDNDDDDEDEDEEEEEEEEGGGGGDDAGMFDAYDDINFNILDPHSLDLNPYTGGGTEHPDIDPDDEMPDLAS